MIRSVFAGALLVGMSGTAMAGITEDYADLCSHMPPLSARRTPTVPFDVYYVPRLAVQSYCAAARPVTACAFPSPGNAAPNRWVIFITETLSDRDTACVLTYESSHLPPNNWFDPRWENYLSGRH
jgi:hypothetical protein